MRCNLPCRISLCSFAQVYRDRDQFASLVREVAAPDVGRMGIEILSFTIKGKKEINKIEREREKEQREYIPHLSHEAP